jgi:hypothetical protein
MNIPRRTHTWLARNLPARNLPARKCQLEKCQPESAGRKVPAGICQPEFASRKVPAGICQPESASQNLPAPNLPARNLPARNLPAGIFQPEFASRKMPAGICTEFPLPEFAGFCPARIESEPEFCHGSQNLPVRICQTQICQPEFAQNFPCRNLPEFAQQELSLSRNFAMVARIYQLEFARRKFAMALPQEHALSSSFTTYLWYVRKTCTYSMRKESMPAVKRI